MALDIICRLLAAPDAASPISSYLVPLSSVWLNILRDCDTHFSLTASSLRHCGPRNFARGGGGDEDRPSVALARLRCWAGTLAEDVLSKRGLTKEVKNYLSFRCDGHFEQLKCKERAHETVATFGNTHSSLLVSTRS